MATNRYTRADPLEVRLWGRVKKTAGCWIWTGYTKKGYGVIGVNGKNRPVFVVAWELENGPVPAGMVLDHEVCDNPLCVRPSHLVLKTPRENKIRSNQPRMVAHRNGTCTKGHLLGNSMKAKRVRCKICGADRQRRYKAKQRAA